MTKQDLLDADKWFALHNIPTNIIDDSSIYYDDCEFEFELSTAEVLYRAELYRNFIKND